MIVWPVPKVRMMSREEFGAGIRSDSEDPDVQSESLSGTCSSMDEGAQILHALPDECPWPPVPVQILDRPYSEDFKNGAVERRQGKPRPRRARNLHSGWLIAGWDAQDEIAREGGFA